MAECLVSEAVRVRDGEAASLLGARIFMVGGFACPCPLKRAGPLTIKKVLSENSSDP